MKGTIYEYRFRNAEDPVKKRIWTERMESYIDTPNYPTVHTCVTNFDFSCNIIIKLAHNRNTLIVKL